MLGPWRAPSSPPEMAHAQQLDLVRGQVALAAIGVAVVAVASVDDDVTLAQVGDDFVDDVVNRSASRDEHHDRPWLCQQVDELLDGLGNADVLALAILMQGGDLAGALVVPGDGKAMVRHVEHEVAPHHAQPDHADIAKVFGHVRWLLH